MAGVLAFWRSMTASTGFTAAGPLGSSGATAGRGAITNTTTTTTTTTSKSPAAAADNLRPDSSNARRDDDGDVGINNHRDGNNTIGNSNTNNTPNDRDAPSLTTHRRQSARLADAAPSHARAPARASTPSPSPLPLSPPSSFPSSFSSPPRPQPCPQQAPSTPVRPAAQERGEPATRSPASTSQKAPTAAAASTSPAETNRPAASPAPQSARPHRHARRAPASRSSLGVSTDRGPPSSRHTQRRPPGALSPPSWAPGQPELLQPKCPSQPSSSDASWFCLPPSSYQSPARRSSSSARALSIQAFTSPGSRTRLVRDMAFQSRPYDLGEDRVDMTDDLTLRALESRIGDDAPNPSPDRSSGTDDTGDVFLKIAREEPARRAADSSVPHELQSPASQTRRFSHRRPLSTAVATYHTASPPRLSRRLSDQQDRAPSRILEEDRATEISRATTYRQLTRDKATSVHPGEEAFVARARSGSTTLRPSPLASRSIAFQDPSPESSTYARRRSSITDGNSTVAGRLSTYKASGLGSSHGKAYSPSPLVRSFDSQNRRGSTHGVEGTESTASTTAPSTVWDELDDLKSRIHRLELTGKLPATSGAAVSRLSDERPPTATTTVTTMSLSPKRQGGQPADAANPTTAQKEAHQILHSALANSRPLMNPDVYRALELAAHDAIGLSVMMGTPGQPGPVSSGASTVGSGKTMTDRQIRRKADGVCRSLTEVCVALGEDAAARLRPAQIKPSTLSQLDGPATPNIPKSYSGLPTPRRASIAAELGLPKSASSPRALSRFEERRHSLLNGTTLPSPRVMGSNPSTPNDSNTSRRSSLLVGRTRRADTEELEDGRTSSVVRARRAGTEEPDEGRRTSLLVRSRRGTVGEEGDESRFRAPSQINTDINMMRGQDHYDYISKVQAALPDPSAQSGASLLRRRYGSTSLPSSRLAAPSGAGSSPAPPRRYLEKYTPERDVAATRPVEEHGSRPPPLSQGMSHLRTNSISARGQKRDSMVSSASSAATAGAYR